MQIRCQNRRRQHWTRTEEVLFCVGVHRISQYILQEGKSYSSLLYYIPSMNFLLFCNEINSVS